MPLLWGMIIHIIHIKLLYYTSQSKLTWTFTTDVIFECLPFTVSPPISRNWAVAPPPQVPRSSSTRSTTGNYLCPGWQTTIYNSYKCKSHINLNITIKRKAICHCAVMATILDNNDINSQQACSPHVSITVGLWGQHLQLPLAVQFLIFYYPHPPTPSYGSKVTRTRQTSLPHLLVKREQENDLMHSHTQNLIKIFFNN